MNNFQVFIIRAIVGAAFAVIITRFFYPQAKIIMAMAVGVFLVGMAYVLEYFRKRKSGK
ncbi:conserved hypothetical protein [Candidatus Magnetomoraceae bacterium gMMP-15]